MIIVKRLGADVNDYVAHQDEIDCERTCPACEGRLHAHDRRQRSVAGRDGKSVVIKLRRYQCKQCKGTATLLPDFLLPRCTYDLRLMAKVVRRYWLSESIRALALEFGLPRTTVQDWCHASRRVQNSLGILVPMILSQLCPQQPPALSGDLGDLMKTLRKAMQEALGVTAVGLPACILNRLLARRGLNLRALLYNPP